MTERVKIPSCCLRTGVRRAVYFLPTLSLSARATPNNYDMVLFKHKKIAESIWKEIDLKAGKYDLSKVSILKDLDMKTAQDCSDGFLER